MSHTTSPAPKAPVEAKVTAATIAAVAVGVVITVLNAAVADDQLLGALPPWLQGILTVVVPPLVTFLAGWKARHTPRTGPQGV